MANTESLTIQKKHIVSAVSITCAVVGAAFAAGAGWRPVAPEAEAHQLAQADHVTADQVRSVITEMQSLRGQLAETTKATNDLNGRLSRLEGAFDALEVRGR